MIAVDTNVLVRFLVEDDARQTERARTLFRRTIESESRAFVSDVVLCELVWVLERSYRFRREEITRVLGRLLRASHLAFSSPEIPIQALESFEAGSGDFADYLIREHASSHGCQAVATFDGDLLKESGFVKV